MCILPQFLKFGRKVTSTWDVGQRYTISQSAGGWLLVPFSFTLPFWKNDVPLLGWHVNLDTFDPRDWLQSDYSLTTVSSYFGNSSDLGLLSHTTRKSHYRIPWRWFALWLWMTLNLTLKVIANNKPKITLMLFQNKETRSFPGSGGENFPSYHKTLLISCIYKPKVFQSGA